MRPAFALLAPLARRDLMTSRPTRRRVLAGTVVAVTTLAATTALVALLEGRPVGLDDASPVYLVAVVAVGSAFGTLPAVGTAIAAFILYDFLFTAPRFSLVVADPREWLDLLLFLFVALVVGRLVATQHARAEEAALRAAEANSLFALSRSLAIAGGTDEAAPAIAARLRDDAGLERAVILAGPPGADRIIGDTHPDAPLSTAPFVMSLVRTDGAAPARWVRTHGPSSGGRMPSDEDQYRVRIEIDGAQLGTILAIRARAGGAPSREATRIMALAADQLGSSLRRDELRQAAVDLEVARRSDTLKTALIDAVSHDLRTPLASIRATAGGLADPDVAWSDGDRRAAALVIDKEVARLDRVVQGLLDLGRIASGAIHPDLEPHELWAIVVPAVDRLRPDLGARQITLDVAVDLPPVLVDAALLDVVVTNLVDNVARHAPAPAPVRLLAATTSDGWLDLTVEDGGPGVGPASVPRLFDRFWRAEPGTARARRGLGIGLSVVRGLVEAMGGTVDAAPSSLGGLAVTIRLRSAPSVPAGPGPGTGP